jgi:hypothetical protein
MGAFTSHPDDQLWKFKIKDLFPHDDELARHVLMVLTANEDLSNRGGPSCLDSMFHFLSGASR